MAQFNVCPEKVTEKKKKLNVNQEIYKEVPKEEYSISPSKLLHGKLKTEDNHMGIKIVERHSIFHPFSLFFHTFGFMGQRDRKSK